jgi:ketosteroid isomerase-like protein
MPIESDVLAELLAMECAALDRWGNGDPSGFLEISAPDVVYFDPFREQRVDGIQELTELYESFRGQVQLQSYEIINPKVQLLPRDGVLREGNGAVLTFNYSSLGKSGKTTRWNCTEVYRKKAEGWEIIQTHWSFTKALG